MSIWGSFRRLMVLVGLLAFSLAGTVAAEERACHALHIPAPVIGPAEGRATLCVRPTQCRDDELAQLFTASQCKDKGARCARGDDLCSLDKLCLPGAAEDSDVVTRVVAYDRNEPCKAPAGTFPCTFKWKIPAKAALRCACGCRD